MFNVRLAGGYLYGKQLFTWLSLVVSLMASFVLSFFPLGVLDEIWDLIESVSEAFLTYSFIVDYKQIYEWTLTLTPSNMVLARDTSSSHDNRLGQVIFKSNYA